MATRDCADVKGSLLADSTRALKDKRDPDEVDCRFKFEREEPSLEDCCVQEEEADERLPHNLKPFEEMTKTHSFYNKDKFTHICEYESVARHHSNVLVLNKGNVKDMDNFKHEIKLIFETSKERKIINPSERLAMRKVMLSQLRVIRSKNDTRDNRQYMFGKNQREFTPCVYTKECLSSTFSRAKGRKMPSNKIMKELFETIKLKNKI